ncbi:unnamed protein product [Bemisia tabaci]|uniref:Rab-like protein 3 n=1 Tax=Bemisia tabaci TaxID=7038 RepID=A0A9P0F337_BEMTA|nr:PREDICTED: rab-like protein 3 [Bemisia tabaci]CAH0386182.1 unnamed protein product [Bemisia tabaci]
MAAIDKVKVLVVGDSGVGKSCLTHLIAEKEPISNPSWTIGCSVEVTLHEYKKGTANQKTYFVELWDIGGSSSHRNARCIFYNPVHGIILVHDLTNRKSQENLQKWLAEILNKEGMMKSFNASFDDFDPEQFIGSAQIPIFVVGTKLDLADKVRTQRRSSTIASECGAEEILINCMRGDSLVTGSAPSEKLSQFFDKVIELRYHSIKDGISPHFNSGIEKPRRPYVSPVVSPKYYHND